MTMFNNIQNQTSQTPLLRTQFPVSQPTPVYENARKSTPAPILFQAAPLVPKAPKSLFRRALPLLFPPLGAYLLIKKITQACLLVIVESQIGPIGAAVFPAPQRFQGKLKAQWQEHKERFLKLPENTCCRLQVKTADGIKLDGTALWKERSLMDAYNADPATADLSGQKWIVCFNGNAMCYENCLDEASALRSDTGCNVMLFNYRGVMDSENNIGAIRPDKDLVLDGDAFIQYLLSKGVKSEDILIHGFSLGGGVGTQVRALHPEGPIANCQSFSSLCGVVTGVVHHTVMREKDKKDNDKKLSWRVQLLIKAIGWIAEGLLKERGCSLNSAAIWDQINGYKWIVTADDDTLLVGQGRLYNTLKHNLKGYRKEDKRDAKNEGQMQLNDQLKASIKHVRSRGTTHGGALTRSAYAKHIAHIKKALG